MTVSRSFLTGVADGLRTVWPAVLVVPAVLIAHEQLTAARWPPETVGIVATIAIVIAEACLGYRLSRMPMSRVKAGVAAVSLVVSLATVAGFELSKRLSL